MANSESKLNQKNYLIILSAPSGAGKTTLCKKLLEEFPAITLSISSTTRAPRGTEQNGVEYFFLSTEEFKRMIDQNLLAEWAQVHGNYYGTSKSVIHRAFSEGRSVLLDIDVQGASLLKKSYPDHCFSIFISPPSLAELESRLRRRGTESEESIQKRLSKAEHEMEKGKTFDAVIVNDSLDRAFTELRDLVLAKLGLKPMQKTNAAKKPKMMRRPRE